MPSFLVLNCGRWHMATPQSSQNNQRALNLCWAAARPSRLAWQQHALTLLLYVWLPWTSVLVLRDTATEHWSMGVPTDHVGASPYEPVARCQLLGGTDGSVVRWREEEIQWMFAYHVISINDAPFHIFYRWNKTTTNIDRGHVHTIVDMVLMLLTILYLAHVSTISTIAIYSDYVQLWIAVAFGMAASLALCLHPCCPAWLKNLGYLVVALQLHGP